MACNIFTYGSLMFPAVWDQVVQGRYLSAKAVLHEHARYAIAGASYPGMVGERDAMVEGVLYFGVDAADVVRLDAFEGDEYRRAAVQTNLQDGRRIDAQTYLYVLPQRLQPAAWDVDAFDIQRFLHAHGPKR